MKKKTTQAAALSKTTEGLDGLVIGFGSFEESAQQRIQGWLQGLLEERRSNGVFQAG